MVKGNTETNKVLGRGVVRKNTRLRENDRAARNGWSPETKQELSLAREDGRRHSIVDPACNSRRKTNRRKFFTPADRPLLEGIKISQNEPARPILNSEREKRGNDA